MINTIILITLMCLGAAMLLVAAFVLLDDRQVSRMNESERVEHYLQQIRKELRKDSPDIGRLNFLDQALILKFKLLDRKGNITRLRSKIESQLMIGESELRHCPFTHKEIDDMAYRIGIPVPPLTLGWAERYKILLENCT